MSSTLVKVVAVGVLATLVIFLMLILLAPRLVARYSLVDKDRLEQTTAARMMVTTAFGVLGLVVGGAATILTLAQSSSSIAFTGEAVKQASETLELSRDSQITDRYSAAVNELASDSFDSRVGGIYALQRIMRQSSVDQPAVAQVLAAFVQKHGHTRNWKGAPPADISNAIRVLADRDTSKDLYKLDLNGTHLEYVELPEARFPAADLSGVQLDGASLDGANFEGADLGDADFSGGSVKRGNLTRAQADDTTFSGAKLQGAHFTNSILKGTDFSSRDTNLKSTDFTGARMTHVDFTGSDLRSTIGLTQEQIDSSDIDKATLCPPALRCGT